MIAERDYQCRRQCSGTITNRAPAPDQIGRYQSRYGWDIPPPRPHITEHRLHQSRCPHCQNVTTASPTGLPPEMCGARTLALLALLHGCFRLSDREIVALCAAVFPLDLSPATVVAAQQQTSQALAPIQATMRGLLEWEARQHGRIATLAQELLVRWPALWTLLTVDGVEPTNHRAEQALRSAGL